MPRPHAARDRRQDGGSPTSDSPSTASTAALNGHLDGTRRILALYCLARLWIVLSDHYHAVSAARYLSLYCFGSGAHGRYMGFLRIDDVGVPHARLGYQQRRNVYGLSHGGAAA